MSNYARRQSLEASPLEVMERTAIILARRAIEDGIDFTMLAVNVQENAEIAACTDFSIAAYYRTCYVTFKACAIHERKANVDMLIGAAKIVKLLYLAELEKSE